MTKTIQEDFVKVYKYYKKIFEKYDLNKELEEECRKYKLTLINTKIGEERDKVLNELTNIIKTKI